MSDSTKTQEDFEKEDEQRKLMHILSLPEADKNGICKVQCGDELCSHGCLQQKAGQFRPQIMQGIKICRERDWYKYPLYVDVFDNQVKRPCPENPLMHCSDPVCNVSGCLGKPAYNFRHLIRIALREKNNK